MARAVAFFYLPKGLMDADPDAVIAANVKRLRDKRCFTQSQLAALTGITRQHISNIERGRGNLTVRTLYGLARALGCDVVDLIPILQEAHKDV